MEKTFFGQISQMGQITKKSALQNEPNTPKLSFSLVLKHFREIDKKKSLYGQKNDPLRKKIRITQEVFFFF